MPDTETEFFPADVHGMTEHHVNLRCENCGGAIHTNDPEKAFDWLEHHLHLGRR